MLLVLWGRWGPAQFLAACLPAQLCSLEVHAHQLRHCTISEPPLLLLLLLAGQAVQRVQHIDGIDFSYQPPPRNIVPFAASLKSQSSTK